MCLAEALRTAVLAGAGNCTADRCMKCQVVDIIITKDITTLDQGIINVTDNSCANFNFAAINYSTVFIDIAHAVSLSWLIDSLMTFTLQNTANYLVPKQILNSVQIIVLI